MARMSWKAPNGVTHALKYDADLVMPMWVTECGMGPITDGLIAVANHKSDCMDCVGHVGPPIRCHLCNDTGYLDYGWADFPCACAAGDKALFVVMNENEEIVSNATGAELKGIIATWRRR